MLSNIQAILSIQTMAHHSVTQHPVLTDPRECCHLILWGTVCGKALHADISKPVPSFSDFAGVAMWCDDTTGGDWEAGVALLLLLSAHIPTAVVLPRFHAAGHHGTIVTLVMMVKSILQIKLKV